jgi:hypothetical protein
VRFIRGECGSTSALLHHVVHHGVDDMDVEPEAAAACSGIDHRSQDRLRFVV